MKLSSKTIAMLTRLIAFALVAWILSQLPLSGFRDTLTSIQIQNWFLWTGLNVLILGLLTGRWLVITRAMALPISFPQIFAVRQAGQLISFVTPGPQFGGEPLQVYWLWKRYAVAGPAAVMAVGLDRFFEFWVNFGVLLIAVLALLASASAVEVQWLTIAASLAGLMLTMAVAAWVLLRQPASIRGFVRRLTAPWQQYPRLLQMGAHWLELSDLLQDIVARHRMALSLALLVSILAWVGMLAEFWFLLYLADSPRDLASFVFLFTVVRLAFLLPLPGGIGSLEAALFWAYQSMEISLAIAAGLIVLMRLRDVLVLLSGAMVLPALNSRGQNQ